MRCQVASWCLGQNAHDGPCTTETELVKLRAVADAAANVVAQWRGDISRKPHIGRLRDALRAWEAGEVYESWYICPTHGAVEVRYPDPCPKCVAGNAG